MSEVVYMDCYKAQKIESIPVVLIIESDDRYFNYVGEVFFASKVSLVRVLDLEKAKTYLESEPFPSVIIFDYYEEMTVEFVKWIQAKPSLQLTFLLLATAELYAEDITRSLRIHDWCPKNLPKEMLGQQIEYSCDYYKEERRRNTRKE